MMKLTRIALTALAGAVMLTACNGGAETETGTVAQALAAAEPHSVQVQDVSLSYTCGPTITVDASVTNTSTVRAWAELIVTDAEGEFFVGDETTVLDPGESADMSFPEF